MALRRLPGAATALLLSGTIASRLSFPLLPPRQRAGVNAELQRCVFLPPPLIKWAARTDLRKKNLRAAVLHQDDTDRTRLTL